MPTQTRFIAPSGGVNLDLSGIFADLDGGTSYGTATKFRVGSVDLTGYFHASTSTEDRPTFNTGYKVNGTDLSAIFRRRGFVGINITQQPTNQLIVNTANTSFSVTATLNGGAFTGTYRWRKNGANLNNVGKISGATSDTLTITGATLDDDAGSYDCVLTSGGSSVTSSPALLQVKPYITSTATVPSPLTADDGTPSVKVQCYAKGSGTINFSWFLNSVAVSGQQNQTANLTNGHEYSFTLNSLTDGSYTCKVTSNLDTTGETSSALVATINAPVVTALRINGTAVGSTANYNDGDGLVLSVDVTSAGATPIYSWYRNSSFVAQGTTYTISSLSDLNSGTYYCTVQNNGGSSTSSTVSIVRYFQSVITDQPDSLPVLANGTNDATFTLVASGLSTPTYKWQRNISGTWTDLTNTGRISGVNLATLTVADVQSGDDGFQFRCIVSNLKADGSSWPNTISATATLTIVTAPSITATNVPVGSYTLYFGDVLNLVVTASGTAPLTYQWYKSGLSLGSANGAQTNNFQKQMAFGDSGSYVCQVTNAYGFAQTGAFTISALNGVPTITAQPSNAVVNNNSSAQFSIVASGPNLFYQWRINGANISGATSSTYTTGALTTANDNNVYTCYVYNNYGNITSSGVSTKIRPYITSIVTNPNPLVFSSGSGPVAVRCYALGSGTIYFSWFKDGVAVPGQQNQTYSQNLVNGQEYVFTLTESTRGAYTCKVTSTYDATGETGGPIYAYMTPNITSHPASATRNAGQSITFSVAAQGTPTLSYQWYRDGSSISGATSSSYTFTASASDNGDSFYCIVQNTILGTTYSSTSSSATLTVYYVTINSHPTGATYNAGNAASLSVNVTANPSPAYRWQYSSDNNNWADVSDNEFVNGNGSSSNNLTFEATGNDTGYYRCKITNSAGTFYSFSAYVLVN